jgi:hypothetical protein
MATFANTGSCRGVAAVQAYSKTQRAGNQFFGKTFAM